IDHQQIARPEQAIQLGEAPIAQSLGGCIDDEQPLAERILARPGRRDHAHCVASIWDTMRAATARGSASTLRSASGTASACIRVSTSPGSTVRKPTPVPASSAAQMRASWSKPALETPYAPQFG